MYAHSWVKAWRFEGDIIWIIKWAMNTEASGAISWAEDAFNIEKTKNMNTKKKSLSSFWGEAPELSEEQRAYFEERWIECNEHILKVFKNYKWAISTTIQSEAWTIKAIQWRKSWDVDKKFRYQIEKEWEDGTWLFSYMPKPDSKVCFLVEGMTDFWTLVQAWVNVKWLVSATTWIQYLKSFDKKYELLYIPDNDESWEKSVSALENYWVKHSTYQLEQFDSGVWDLNDAWKMAKDFGMTIQEFLKEIYESRDRPPENIDLAIARAKENASMWSWKIWDPVFDKATWGIIPWSLMVINGFTWEGKTTTLDWIIKKLTEVHQKKVAYCSLDDDIGKMLAMFLWRKFNQGWQTEVQPHIDKYIDLYWRDKFDIFKLYDDVNTLDEFTDLVKTEKFDVLIVDFIQDIEWLQWGNPKEKMMNASTWLYRIAKENRCAVIALSQASMGEVSKPVLQRNPNESFMIRAKADTFINVWVYNGKHKIWFAKNKYWSTKYKFTEHDTIWDEKTWDISIFQDFSVDWSWMI